MLLLGAAVFLLLMAGLFVPLEAWFPARTSVTATHKAMLTAFGLFALNLLLMELLGAPLLDWVEESVASEAAPSALKVALVFGLADIAGYWAHRLMHRVPLLWRFHSVCQ